MKPIEHLQSFVPRTNADLSERVREAALALQTDPQLTVLYDLLQEVMETLDNAGKIEDLQSQHDSLKDRIENASTGLSELADAIRPLRDILNDDSRSHLDSLWDAVVATDGLDSEVSLAPAVARTKGKKKSTPPPEPIQVDAILGALNPESVELLVRTALIDPDLDLRDYVLEAVKTAFAPKPW